MRDRWHRAAHRRMRHSLKARLVLVFLFLAFALAGAFMFGTQKALSTGWRDAARPLLTDYVDRLAREIGTPPDAARAEALTRRLPITIRITGPQVQWASPDDDGERPRRWLRPDGEEWSLLTRTTADGHRIEFGLNLKPWRDRPRMWGVATLLMLLLLTAMAYKFVRRLLRPLDDIRAGAQRYGQGRFDEPIPIRRRDELGDLAGDVNAMARSIHQMLEAKRALLLAISHELRSPITRARLNTELLPEEGEAAARRAALLRDLQEMADLVTELLESERLGQGHAALQREPTDLPALVREVAASFPGVRVEAAAGTEVPIAVDRARLRLLVRNLLDNALRHSVQSSAAPCIAVDLDGAAMTLTVRDFGPGVDEDVIAHLAEPFYRPDASRERGTGGVGLGLHLCKLVALAHGGGFDIRNAHPGLEVRVRLPA